VPVVIANLYRLEVDPTVRATAAAFPNPGLRSLDAIHLATALVVARELQAFVTYDVRLRDAARQAGLPVANPGQGTDLPLKPA
jgi:predicted nucleic acid-binding protein